MSKNDEFPLREKPVIDRPLIAYAFLAQATNVSNDLLSGLAPIFKPIAKEKVGKRFDAAEFSEEVKALYGIEIHPWAVDDLAPRLESAGLLAKNNVSETCFEYVYAEVTGNFDEVSEADIRLAIRRFIDFSTPILQRNKVDVDEKALEEAFLAQLVAMDFHSILLKPDRTKEDQKSPGTLSVPKKPEKAEWEEAVSAKAKADVLCASFIVDAYHNDKALYDLIVRIASGALIAEVVLNVQDPGTSITLNSLKVVLDAPFVMSLLDLSSEEATTYARSLFEKLKENGASVLVFRHSIKEIHSNLRGVLNNVSHGGGYGPTARRLGSSAFQTYVNSIMPDIEAAVSRYDIKVIDTPTAAGAYNFLSEGDENTFRLSLGYFENPTAQARDAASVAGVIRLRQGKTAKMSRFHMAQYVFVTENPWIADRSASFARNKKILVDNEVPPAITDRYLAGLMWVLFGGKASELTQYRLLANCTAALEPRNDVIAKMHRFLSQLDEYKARQFRALMTDERAGQHLMQLTLGDSVLITSTDDADRILEQVESVLGEKYRKKHEEKLLEITDSHRQEMSQVLAEQQSLADELRANREQVSAIQDALSDVQSRSNHLTQALNTEKLQRLEEKRRLVVRSVGYAREASHRRQWGISIGIGFGAMLCTFAGTEYLTQFGKWISALGAIATGGITCIAFGKNPELIFGAHLVNLRNRVFQMKAEEYHVLNELDQFDIDWQTGNVRIKESGGA